MKKKLPTQSKQGRQIETDSVWISQVAWLKAKHINRESFRNLQKCNLKSKHVHKSLK